MTYIDNKKHHALLKRSVVVLGMLISPCLLAKDLYFDLGVDLERVEQDIFVKNEERDVDSSSNIVRPYLAVIYEGSKLDAYFRGTQNHVQRELDGVDATQNYTVFNYATSYDIVDNLLELQLNGAQEYRSEGINTFLESDFLLYGEELNKVQNNSALLNLNLPRGDYFGLSGSARYSKIKSENSRINPNRFSGLFDSENYGANFNLVSGKDLEDTQLTLYGNVNYSQRQSNQDYESQTLGFESDSKLISDFGFVVNGYYENNDIKNDVETDVSRLREFYSIGAGLSWQPASNKIIKVTWNRSFTESKIDDSEEEENSYLSYNIDWSFSTRTQLQASFSRRFFGDSKQLSLIHRLRNWRSSINYNETVSNASQLINNPDLGLFVCDAGSINLSDCSLTDNLDTPLEPGQVAQSFLIPNFELNDRVILRKGWTLQSAYTSRRTTLSVTGSRTDNEDLEIDSLYETDSLSATIAIDISHKTRFDITQRYTKVERMLDAVFEQETTKEQSLTLSHDLSRRFSASVGVTKVDREGNLSRQDQTFSGLNGPLTDNRITFTISYNYGDRR